MSPGGNREILVILSFRKESRISVKQLKSELHAYISDKDFAPAAEYFTAHAAPCIRFRDLGGFEDAPIGATRFGGDPDLPPSQQWPTDPDAPADRNALLFAAQLNFAELPGWRGCPLPKKGMLSVFVGIGGLQGFSTALFFPKTDGLVRCSTPLDRLGPEYSKDEYLAPCRAEPILALSIPATVEHFRNRIAELCKDVESIDFDYPEINDDFQMIEQATGPDDWFSQLLGYAIPPYLPHQQYHEQAAARRLGINANVGRRGTFDLAALPNPNDRRSIEEESLRFPLLLSMHSRGTTGAMWSDCGTIHVLAHEDQIRSRDFDRLPTFLYH